MKKESVGESQVFIGRLKEIDQVYKAIGEAKHYKSGALINIWGLHGMGKTSFLNKLCQDNDIVIDGQEIKFLPLYINLTSLKTKDDIRTSLAKAVLETLRSMPDSINGIEISLDRIEELSLKETESDLIEKVFSSFTPQRTLLFAFDDFHLLENFNPELGQWLLDTVVTPLIRSLKSIVVIAGDFPLGNNPNISESQKMKLRKFPIPIKLGGLSLAETRLLLQRHITGVKEDIANAVYESTSGHLGLVLTALQYIQDQKIQPEYWHEADIKIQDIFTEGYSNKEIRDLRVSLLPAVKQLSVFRKFSVGLFDDAKIRIRGFEEKPVHQLISMFLKANLISYDSQKGGYVVDAELRQIGVKMLSHSDMDVWISTHLAGFDLYYKLLQEYPVNSDAYLLEFFYHALNLLVIDDDFGNIFIDKLESLENKVKFDRASLNQSVLSDQQIQFLVKKPSVDFYLKSLQGWILNPGKGISKMSRKQNSSLSDSFVSVKIEDLIGEERNRQFNEILDKLYKSNRASIIVVGNGGIGKSDLLRRIVEKVKLDQDNSNIVILGEGIIDLAVSVRRDPLYLMQWISNEIENSFPKKNYFEKFNRKYSEYREQVNAYNRVLRHTEISIDILFPIWVEEYNQVTDAEKCRILLCFDTVERLYKDSILNGYIKKLFDDQSGLKKTLFLFAGRNIDPLLRGELSKYDDSKSALVEKLIPLSDSDTHQYIISMDPKKAYFIDPQEEQTYCILSQGYPVIISLLVPLAKKDPSILVGMDRDTTIKSAIKLADRNDPGSLAPIFQLVCGKFVEYIQNQKKEVVSSISIYDLILQVRRGLNGDLLSYIEDRFGNKRSVEDCQGEILRWSDYFNPLIKQISLPKTTDATERYMIVAHDVIFEHAAQALPKEERVKILKWIVDFYQMCRKEFSDAPRLSTDNPEEYLTILLDSLFYEYALKPWKSLQILNEEIRKAYRQGESLLMERLWEEWYLLVIDKTIPLLGQEIPDSKYFSLEKKFLDIRKKNLEGHYSSDSLRSLLSEIDALEEQSNIDADGFLETLRTDVVLELAKVRILTEDFSDTADFEALQQDLDLIIVTLEETGMDIQILADAYSTCALCWEQTMRYDRAYSKLLKALPLYINLKIYPDAARCQSQLSLLSLMRGQISTAEQHYALANDLAVNLEKDSLSVSLVERALAHLYLRHGNSRRANEIFGNLVNSPSEFSRYSNRPHYEQMLLSFSAVNMKIFEISLNVILKDFLSFSNNNQIDEIEDFFKKTYQYPKSDINLFDLAYIRSDFYLCLLNGLHLVPDLNKKENSDRFIAYVKDSLDIMSKIDNSMRYVFGWRLLKYYLTMAKGNFFTGNIDEANVANLKAQEEIGRLKNVFLEERRIAAKSGEYLPFFKDLGELFPEFYRLEGEMNLLSGHILLKDNANKQLMLNNALDFYELALKQLLQYPERMFLTLAFEQIWKNLKDLFDEDNLYSVFASVLRNRPPSDTERERAIQYLDESLRVRSGILK
jgi:Cdc6-like AAA superfamily ATPase